jgi:hypothetical protein
MNTVAITVVQPPLAARPARACRKCSRDKWAAAREQADSLFREMVNYRFGVTSSLVVEAAGLDELPGPGCAFFMRLE